MSDPVEAATKELREIARREGLDRHLANDLLTAANRIDGRIATLEGRLERVSGALEKHGRHHEDCAFLLFADHQPCNCGFRAALETEVDGEA